MPPTTPATVSRAFHAATSGSTRKNSQIAANPIPQRRATGVGGIGVPRHARHASRHTRAVSLLIRHAAPSTKMASQANALTTAYQGSSWVSGARATSATPYIGVQ